MANQQTDLSEFKNSDAPRYVWRARFFRRAPVLGLSSVFLILIMGASLFAYKYAINTNDSRSQEQFLNAVRDKEVAIRPTLALYRANLESMQALFSLDGGISRKDFYNFAANADFIYNLPGVRAIGFIKRVSHEQKDAFIKTVRLDKSIFPAGYPDFSVYPEVSKDEYYVGDYVEPYTGREKVLGFDFSSEAVRWEAMQAARDSGNAIISGPTVSFIDQEPFILMFAPIYKNGMPIATIDERRVALSGFVYIGFRTRELFPGIFKQENGETIDVEIYDSGRLDKESLLYDSDNSYAALHVSTGLRVAYYDDEIAGRRWGVYYLASQNFGMDFIRINLPIFILVFGSLFSILAFIVVYALFLSRIKAVKLAEEMTEQIKSQATSILKAKNEATALAEAVRKSKEISDNRADDLQKFSLAVDNSSDHITITDPEGVILYVNVAAEKITGYSRAEIIGKRPSLWGNHMGKEFYQNMWKIIKIDKKPFTAEIRNRRKNGDLYLAFAHVYPILDVSGNIKFFVGVERDITQEKEGLRRLEEAKLKDEAFLASIGDGVVATDKDGGVILFNNAAHDMMQWDLNEVIGKLWSDLIDPKDESGKPIPKDLRVVNIALRTHSTARASYFYTKKDGTQFFVSIIASPILLQGELVGAVVAFRDITKEHATDRAKTEFVSLASHQLRTPLATTNWYAEMLMEGGAKKLTPNQRKYLREIYRSNRRMIELVNGLLNISRIELGTFIQQPTAGNLIEAIEAIISELSLQIKNRKIKLHKEFDESAAIEEADVNSVRVIIQNLLSNAIKYNRIGGEVNLSLNLSGDNLLFTISDNGYGIPEEEQGRIFERFFRASNAIDKDTDGTGLGLYMVKILLDKSGGKITFESKENKGTTFNVSLPRLRARQDDSRATE